MKFHYMYCPIQTDKGSCNQYVANKGMFSDICMLHGDVREEITLAEDEGKTVTEEEFYRKNLKKVEWTASWEPDLEDIIGVTEEKPKGFWAGLLWKHTKPTLFRIKIIDSNYVYLEKEVG